MKKLLNTFFNPPERFRKLIVRPDGVSVLKWRFIVVKKLFDQGYAQTNYIKYVIALFGLSSLDLGKTLIFASVYIPFCILIGYIYFLYQFAELETEWGNRFNFFVREMRDMRKELEKTS